MDGDWRADNCKSNKKHPTIPRRQAPCGCLRKFIPFFMPVTCSQAVRSRKRCLVHFAIFKRISPKRRFFWKGTRVFAEVILTSHLTVYGMCASIYRRNLRPLLRSTVPSRSPCKRRTFTQQFFSPNDTEDGKSSLTERKYASLLSTISGGTWVIVLLWNSIL